jgi:tetratricopeptide (TPR) repeat protein
MIRIWTCAAALAMMAALAVAQKPKSQKEIDALMAIQNAPTADERVKKVDEFVVNFPDSEFRAAVLLAAADAASRKGDSAKVGFYVDQVLAIDPKNYTAMLIVSSDLAQHTREFDLDKEEKLANAEKNAKTALELIPNAPKPRPDLADDQWAGEKRMRIEQAHETLGMVAALRKKYDVAIAEFKLAADDPNPDPSTLVRLAQAYNSSGKPDEALSIANKLLATPDLNPVVKQYAQTEKSKAEKAKTAKP